MINEKFQEIVLEKLTNLEEGQNKLVERVDLIGYPSFIRDILSE